MQNMLIVGVWNGRVKLGVCRLWVVAIWLGHERVIIATCKAYKPAAACCFSVIRSSLC